MSLGLWLVGRRTLNRSAAGRAITLHLGESRFRRRKRALRGVLCVQLHVQQLQFLTLSAFECGEPHLRLRGRGDNQPVDGAVSAIFVSGDHLGCRQRTPGYWGWTNNTAAGAGLPLSYGRLGELATLDFDVGGFDDTGYTFGYYTSVYLPGDWTTPGTGTGDYNSVSVAAGFSPPTFTYHPITTLQQCLLLISASQAMAQGPTCSSGW